MDSGQECLSTIHSLLVMCGINGFTSHDPDRLRAMHGATRHRGPDDEGFFESEGISLAQNRLSIIDLSSAGHQPMTTVDGRYTIVFNGEIYNYAVLRADLESHGIRFVGASDTEVLLYAYATWGKDCLKRLNGIFAFAIWDRDERELLLVRDPIGIKPLYYHFADGQLSFSSEIKALLKAGAPASLDDASLNLYFYLLYTPGERTMFTGIKRLEPGMMLKYRYGSMMLERYSDFIESSAPASYAEAKEGIRERAYTSIKRQLVSDRPLGVFLSGGIDSSSILGMMRDQQPSGVIRAFTIGYHSDVESERYNADVELAAKTAKHFGAEHHVYTLGPDDVMQVMDDVIWHMDEPIANHIQSSTFLLAKYAKPEITVALGGDGGDELFGGYPRYWYANQLERLYGFRPLFANPVLRSFCRAIGKNDLCEKFASKRGIERHLAFISQKEAMISSFYQKRNAKIFDSVFQHAYRGDWRDPINQMMVADLRTWIPEESSIRTDKLTMAHGLEERVPLLDLDLVSYALSIPSAYKLGTAKQGKRIFIDAMRPYLPEHLLHEEKRAWMSPMAKWLRGPLLPWMREILSPSYCAGTRDLFDFQAIEHVIDGHLSKRQYALAPLWSLMTFQLWYRAFLEQKD